MWNFKIIVCTVMMMTTVLGFPKKHGTLEQTPAQDRSWFKKKGPQFEINPNFGFRSYHQVRYEPMTVPFENEYAPPLPPMEFNLPVSTGAEDGAFMDGGYQPQPAASNVNEQFSSRQSHVVPDNGQNYRRYY